MPARDFRIHTFYRSLTARADVLFELTDAVLCADGPVRSLVELTDRRAPPRAWRDVRRAQSRPGGTRTAAPTRLVAAVAPGREAQRLARNRPWGYWIAEADPDAAEHGLNRHVPATEITWAVLASDGAADLIDYAGHHWPAIAHADADQLTRLLAELHDWEATVDPDGRALPRAKRHDDKTLVAIDSVW
jgi:hypothetical protein